MRLEDQLRDLIKNQFGGIPKFAEFINEPPTSIYGALSRGMKNTRTELTDKIYKGLKIDMNTVSFDDSVKLGLLDDTRSSFVNIPVISHISAGTPIELMPVDFTHPVPTVIHDRYPDARLFKIDGDSMNRILPNGCYALVDPCNEVDRSGEPYAVCVNGHDATVKRVELLNNGFRLVPDSTDPTYAVQTFNYNEPGTETITVIGRVVYYVLPFDWKF